MATLKALAPRQDELGVRLAVNQTIVDAESAGQYGELRDLLRPMGIHNQVVVAYEASATYSLSRETTLKPKTPGAFTTFGKLSREACLALGAKKQSKTIIHGNPGTSRANECWLQHSCVDLRPHGEFTMFRM